MEENNNANGTKQESEISRFDTSSRYHSLLPELLEELNVAIMMTSYQAGKLITLRSHNGKIDTHFLDCPRPMGLAINNKHLTLGIWAQILDYRRDDTISRQVSDSDIVDSFFIPRTSHVSGMINIHDIAWGEDGTLWAVNSSFSCICKITPQFSFEPYWKPKWITELVPEDRCHLNGMALKEGKPRYVTAFNQSDQAGHWRNIGNNSEGVLIDIHNNEVLVDGICMPHSPRYINEHVYFCESGAGIVWKLDPNTRKKTIFCKIQGFTRGMSHYGGLLFVATSKIRPSENNIYMPIRNEFEHTECGLWVLDINSGELITFLEFDGDISQLYDVAIAENCHFPEVMEWRDEVLADYFQFPSTGNVS